MGGLARLGVSTGLAIALALAGNTLASADSSAPAQREQEAVPASLLKLHWTAGFYREGHLVRVPTRGNTLTIWIQLPGYCLGEPRYRLDHLKVVERPKAQSQNFASTVITAFIFRPAFERDVPGQEGNVVYGVCADIGPGQKMVRVRLKRPASRLVFYDGDFARPHRVYPPVGTSPGS